MGPKNITRIEGETGIYIPCPFAGSSVPVWEINGTRYEYIALPTAYKQDRFGLLINEVEIAMNNTAYRCLYPTGRNFKVKKSKIGTLSVMYNN